jgi:hypothetical protein
VTLPIGRQGPAAERAPEYIRQVKVRGTGRNIVFPCREEDNHKPKGTTRIYSSQSICIEALFGCVRILLKPHVLKWKGVELN